MEARGCLFFMRERRMDRFTPLKTSLPYREAQRLQSLSELGVVIRTYNIRDDLYRLMILTDILRYTACLQVENNKMATETADPRYTFCFHVAPLTPITLTDSLNIAFI